ncbi:hypothetical protein BDV40DRAFT_171066 [Aspergillus tamarii]|uniref:Glycine zipper 2TM domain-containing protein n=1 Tax=Aspergillus tamarii TaxID=41984 RepID=A0A5N6UTP4_ASPTM|nr:hypothetical protein BDV40DRAFT_171066 [Aspergillus tamarii]
MDSLLDTIRDTTVALAPAPAPPTTTMAAADSTSTTSNPMVVSRTMASSKDMVSRVATKGMYPHQHLPTLLDQSTNFSSHRSGEQGPGGAQDGERGLGGALAGGLAGGFAGHKADHGFLGAVGGAILGHIAQDGWKQHKDKKEHEQQQQEYGGYGGSQYGGPPSQGGSGGNPMMDQLGSFFNKR